MREQISKEDYLKVIYDISIESQNGIHLVDVSKRLNVSKPAVTEMFRKLSKSGLIKYEPYKSITLTPKGKKIGQDMTSRHRIIERFLKEILSLDTDLIHEEAHKLEHAFSDESIAKIDKILKHPTCCPHGSPIPRTEKCSDNK